MLLSPISLPKIWRQISTAYWDRRYYLETKWVFRQLRTGCNYIV